MFKSLSINNYALIDRLDISVEPGFTVITGETGAGKSIMLGALGILLGGRAEARAVRTDGRGKMRGRSGVRRERTRHTRFF